MGNYLLSLHSLKNYYFQNIWIFIRRYLITNSWSTYFFLTYIFLSKSNMWGLSHAFLIAKVDVDSSSSWNMHSIFQLAKMRQAPISDSVEPHNYRTLHPIFTNLGLHTLGYEIRGFQIICRAVCNRQWHFYACLQKICRLLQIQLWNLWAYLNPCPIFYLLCGSEEAWLIFNNFCLLM